MDAKMLELFRNIQRDLNYNCSKLPCGQCAFDCNGYCGTVVLQSIMAKLTGGEIIELQQVLSDEGLRDFISRNPQREE